MTRDEFLSTVSAATGFSKAVLSGEFSGEWPPEDDMRPYIAFLARFRIKRHGLSLPPEIQARYFLRKAHNYRRYARRMRRIYSSWGSKK